MLTSLVLLLAAELDPAASGATSPPVPAPATTAVAPQMVEPAVPSVVVQPTVQPTVQAAGASLLNPALSLIVDSTFGYYGRNVGDFRALGLPLAGDDPTDAREGFGLQEVELAAQAAIDPYLQGAVFLTVPNLEGIEVEEAYLVTTSLPANLQFKGGSFRSQFGRNNGQHLHLQHFTRRPLLTALLLGGDGFRGPGAQASVLLPLPWFATLYAEGFSIAPPEEGEVLSTFGGGARPTPSQLTYTAVLEQYWDLSENTSLLFGVNFATGRSFDPVAVASGPRSYLYGGDLYFKWKPPTVANTYTSLQWTTELFLRSLEGGGATEGAGYTEPVLQVARRWYAGARFDLTGIPAGESVPRRYGYAASLTFAPSEFSRFRLYAQELTGGGLSTTVAFLQAEFSIGAHGAHPF